jgi:lysophospholipase L1-like esterase
MTERDVRWPGASEHENASHSPRVPTSLLGRQRRLQARLLLILGGTVVGLVLAEIAVRVGAAVMHRDPLIVSDARVGWALQPNLRRVIRAGNGGQYVMSTDAEGHRITRAANEHSPGHLPIVIILGDSYIQPVGANDEDAFAWILAHDMPVNVVNLAVLGYGTDQQLASLETFLETHPSLDVHDVVVFVTENDFTDVQADYNYLGRTKPRFQIEGGRLQRADYRPCLSDRLMDVSYLYWLANSKLAAHFHDAPKDPRAGIDVVVACLTAMRAAAMRRGARLHVLVHHLIKIHPLTDSQWADFRHRTGATDITERLRTEDVPAPIGYDRFHWSAAGHRRVAALVKEQLEPASTTAITDRRPHG